MYDPNRHPLEDGPKKYGAAAATEELFKTSYAGDHSEDTEYDSGVKYNSSDDNSDPFKVGYNTGSSDADDKKNHVEDELWKKVDEEKKDDVKPESDEDVLFNALTKSISQETFTSKKTDEDEEKNQQDIKKKNIKSVEEVIELVSQPKNKLKVINLDE